MFYGVEIEVFHGDITKLEVDAIVNAANTHLYMIGGVAGAIKKAGGKEIEEEAIKKGPINIGEAVVTSAGKLKSKFVIHSPTMGLDFKTDEQKVRLALTAALKKAEELGIKSLALPALGTGVGGLSRDKVAQIMVEEIKKHIETGTNLRKLIIVDINKEQVEIFKKKVEALK
ncbi:MAG: macro domain-containing protein [Archaeoglobaceae archaeon]|nr:macro domain-containing protein [Archaeoglobaceae archaeon]MCX8000423.1 macro domain-containing protein [Leptospiraceae bacterium]MDW7990137.1 macro domain-containing protein [Archaeoglobaceae archaeon]